MASFQTKFKELRNSAGFTQQELAKKFGVSQSTITMWENGKRQPDLETMECIADFFNVDMNYLTGTSSRTTKILDQDQFELISLYDLLNEDGRAKLREYASDLVASGRYKKAGSEARVG